MDGGILRKGKNKNLFENFHIVCPIEKKNIWLKQKNDNRSKSHFKQKLNKK